MIKNAGNDLSMDRLAQARVTAQLVKDVCYRIHRSVGPGFREPLYRKFLGYGLRKAGCEVLEEVCIPVEFDGCVLQAALRSDLLVNDEVIVELKAVEGLRPVDHAQLRSYLRASGVPVGILVNFHEARLKDGFHECVHPALYDRKPTS